MIVAESPATPPAPVEKGARLELVYCHKCRRPVGRALLKAGSVVEFRCKSCGAKHTEVGG